MTPEQRMREAGERLVEVIARQEWLNPWGYKLEHAMAVGWDLLGARRDRVRNVLHGTWLGHPLHPVLTDVPLGAWTMAFAFDALDRRVSDAAHFGDAARFALGAGVLGGVGAALTGLTDWQYTHDDARRTGLVHGVCNLAALVLCASSWWRRRTKRDRWSRLGSGLGYGLALGSSFLGGNLVFRERIGVDRTEHPLEPREFTPVIFESELADERLQHVRVGDADMILVRSGGRVYAYGEHCPHLGAPLSDGWLFGWKHRLSVARRALRIEVGLDGQRPRNLSADLLRDSRAGGEYRSPFARAREPPRPPEDDQTAMKADEVLIAHHGVLRALLARIEAMPGSDPERPRLLDELVKELNIHTKIEEQLFYPAARKASRLVDISFAEHRQLDDQVAVVLRTDIESARFDEEFRALRAGVEEHAGEEERIMFPECQALGDAKLEALGVRLQRRMEQLRRSKIARALIVLKRETLRRV